MVNETSSPVVQVNIIQIHFQFLIDELNEKQKQFIAEDIFQQKYALHFLIELPPQPFNFQSYCTITCPCVKIQQKEYSVILKNILEEPLIRICKKKRLQLLYEKSMQLLLLYLEISYQV